MVSQAPAFTLSEEDFRLFEENRQSSNRFNRERLELREKLEKIGSFLLSRIPFPATWKMEIGTEHPAIWNQRQVDRLEVFYMRGAEDRKILAKAMGREIPLSTLMDAPSPLYGHASLGFIMDVNGIEAGFRIPFLAVGDRGTLKKLLEDPARQEKLANLTETCPELTFGVFSRKPFEAMDPGLPANWEKGLAELESVGGNHHRSFLGLVRRFSVAELADGVDVAALMLPLLAALVEIASEMTWNKDFDTLGIDGLIQAQKTAMEAERERSEQKRQELIQPKPVIARPRLTSADPHREQVPERRKTGHTPSTAPRMEKPANHVPRSGPAPSGKSREPKKTLPPRPLEIGDRVILNSGVFQGKEGIVLELLPDQQLRVRVGIMQMTIRLADCSFPGKNNRR